MGLCQSEEERKQAVESHAIDKQLREAFKIERRVHKLLLLGTGECGKSTLIKQMQILHSNGFSQDEMMQKRPIVYRNAIQGMETLLRGMRSYKIPFNNPELEADSVAVMKAAECEDEIFETLPDKLIVALKRLWADSGVNSKAYSRRSEFHLQESAKHFLDSLDRICAPDYKPTETDILLMRVQTSGIVEMSFEIKNLPFRVFDVGGQRSERKKWIHCFDDVNALIYIVAVSEYDQVLVEDHATNRMTESLRLFEAISNSRWFIQSAIILFLNKKDLFAEKIRRVSIRACFGEYTGPQTYDDCMAFIKGKFQSVYMNKEKSLYVHQTCATDTNQVQLILESVIDTIIESNLRSSGFQY